MKTIFITAIDTNSGKTIITGCLAKYLLSKGKNVTTQKIVQTGCVGISDDILMHRKIMNREINEFDKNGISCPYNFKHPASPHLAAALENTEIITENIKNATLQLENNFELVLLEGAGGIHVPLNNSENIVDYIQKQNYPVILITTSKLGSINHTLLSLEVLKNRNINVIALIYNHFPALDIEIVKNSGVTFQRFLYNYFPSAQFIEVPLLQNNYNVNFNLNCLSI